jgi:PKD repeat protein
VCKTQVVYYECTLVTLVQDKVDAHKITVTINANHDSTTKISSYVIDFGDGSTPLTTNQSPYTYTYKKEGTFNVVAKVNFTLADTTSKNNIGSNGCIKTVTITSKPKTPPVVLPNTGAGSTLAIFAATSFIAAMFYRFNLVRRTR